MQHVVHVLSYHCPCGRLLNCDLRWTSSAFIALVGVRLHCQVMGLGVAGGRPLVVAEPMSATAQAFMELGAMVVREIAKLKRQPRNAVRCALCG